MNTSLPQEYNTAIGDRTLPVAVLPVAVVFTWQDPTFWKGAFRWQDNLE